MYTKFHESGTPIALSKIVATFIPHSFDKRVLTLTYMDDLSTDEHGESIAEISPGSLSENMNQLASTKLIRTGIAVDYIRRVKQDLERLFGDRATEIVVLTPSMLGITIRIPYSLPNLYDALETDYIQGSTCRALEIRDSHNRIVLDIMKGDTRLSYSVYLGKYGQ